MADGWFTGKAYMALAARICMALGPTNLCNLGRVVSSVLNVARGNPTFQRQEVCSMLPVRQRSATFRPASGCKQSSKLASSVNLLRLISPPEQLREHRVLIEVFDSSPHAVAVLRMSLGQVGPNGASTLPSIAIGTTPVAVVRRPRLSGSARAPFAALRERQIEVARRRTTQDRGDRASGHPSGLSEGILSNAKSAPGWAATRRARRGRTCNAEAAPRRRMKSPHRPAVASSVTSGPSPARPVRSDSPADRPRTAGFY